MTRQYKPIKHLPTKLRYGTWITYLLLATVVGLFCYWGLLRQQFSIAIFVVQSTPLLALVPGLVSRSYRSYSWLCFVLLFYFILAVERALTSVASFTDFIFLTVVIMLFISSMMTSRWLQRTLKSLPESNLNTLEDHQAK